MNSTSGLEPADDGDLQASSFDAWSTNTQRGVTRQRSSSSLSSTSPTIDSVGDSTKATETTVSETRSKEKKTRRRKPVNCSFCRRRKLKCDRNYPCSNCVKRNIASACTYAAKPSNSFSSKLSQDDNTSDILVVDDMFDNAQKPDSDRTSDPTSASTSQNNNSDAQATSKESQSRPLPKGRPYLPPNSSNTISARSANTRQPHLGSGRRNIFHFSALAPALKNSASTSPSNSNKSPSDPTTSGSSSDQKSSPSSSIQDDEASSYSVKKAKESLGILEVEMSGKSIYHGDMHWSSLFVEVQELEQLVHQMKITNGVPVLCDAFSPEPETYESNPSTYCTSPSSKMNPIEVLKTIPPRPVCDTLIKRYFEVCEPLFPILNATVLQKEYMDFWQHPTDTELIWVSLFLGVLTLGLQSYGTGPHPFNFTAPANEIWPVWLEGSELCSYLGKLSFRPSLNSIRSIIVWIFCQPPVVSKTYWLDRTTTQIAMLVRTCQSIGLHRDPKWFNISPFEAEERRRIWYVVQYLDLYCSFTQGMPANIRTDCFDVKLPANINKREILPTSEKEPTPRPESALTDSTYLISRARLSTLQAQIVEETSNFGPLAKKVTYEHVIRTQEKLEDTFKSSPFYAASVLTQAEDTLASPVTIQRFFYEVDYLKTVLILHRYYSALGMEDPKYKQSRAATLYATVRMLKLHHWINYSLDNSLMPAQYQYLVDHLLTPHFLHASVFICIALINHYDSFKLEEVKEYTRLAELSMDIFYNKTKGFGLCARLTLFLIAIMGRVHEVGTLTKKQREDLQPQDSLIPKRGTLTLPTNVASVTINSTQSYMKQRSEDFSSTLRPDSELEQKSTNSPRSLLFENCSSDREPPTSGRLVGVPPNNSMSESEHGFSQTPQTSANSSTSNLKGQSTASNPVNPVEPMNDMEFFEDLGSTNFGKVFGLPVGKIPTELEESYQEHAVPQLQDALDGDVDLADPNVLDMTMAELDSMYNLPQYSTNDAWQMYNNGTQ